MGEALRTIAFKVRTASCGGTACVNSFGDEQLAVDMLADKLLFEVRINPQNKIGLLYGQLMVNLILLCFCISVPNLSLKGIKTEVKSYS